MIDGSSLAVLLLLAAVVSVPLLLRRQRAKAPDGLRVVARTALSKHAVVAVVAVGDRRLLIGAGDQGIRLRADLDEGDPSAPATAEAPPAVDEPHRTISLDRTDADELTTSTTHGSLAALVDGANGGLDDQHGPGNGLVDRLRAMTVRTPQPGRPVHDVLRR